MSGEKQIQFYLAFENQSNQKKTIVPYEINSWNQTQKKNVITKRVQFPKRYSSLSPVKPKEFFKQNKENKDKNKPVTQNSQNIKIRVRTAKIREDKEKVPLNLVTNIPISHQNEYKEPQTTKHTSRGYIMNQLRKISLQKRSIKKFSLEKVRQNERLKDNRLLIQDEPCDVTNIRVMRRDRKIIRRKNELLHLR